MSSHVYKKYHLSHRMRKPICICAFVFTTRIVPFLFCLYPKFQTSSLLVWLYRPVCARPGQNPHCWFAHAVAYLLLLLQIVVAATDRGNPPRSDTTTLTLFVVRNRLPQITPSNNVTTINRETSTQTVINSFRAVDNDQVSPHSDGSF